MSKHVEIVAKGLVLDNAIDDMIRELSLVTRRTESIYSDYKFYKPCIVNCESLYRFITIKFYSKESIMRNYQDYLSQADFGIFNFIDYCIVDFTRGTNMKEISDVEKALINRKIDERLKNLNRSIQWAMK